MRVIQKVPEGVGEQDSFSLFLKYILLWYQCTCSNDAYVGHSKSYKPHQEVVGETR